MVSHNYCIVCVLLGCGSGFHLFTCGDTKYSLVSQHTKSYVLVCAYAHTQHIYVCMFINYVDITFHTLVCISFVKIVCNTCQQI
jgi:hypothetical protein